MKFRYIAKVDVPTKTYDGHMVSAGDIIDLDGYVAEKALKDPTLEPVNEQAVHAGNAANIEPVKKVGKKAK